MPFFLESEILKVRSIFGAIVAFFERKIKFTYVEWKKKQTNKNKTKQKKRLIVLKSEKPFMFVLQDFSVDVFFRQYWRDPRLNHTLEEPIFLTGSYRNLIWLPDTFFLNIKTANFHNVPADNSRVKIRTDGQVTWSSR